MTAYLLSLSLANLVALSLPLLIGCLVGAVLSAVVQMVLQIEERAISFLFRLSGVGIGLYLSIQGGSFGPILKFTESAWGELLLQSARRGGAP